MKRVMMELAYDGTNYCGFQIQNNEITVEGVVNQCLCELLREEIVVIGASRTDSGVHAKGNVIVFDTETRIDTSKLARALNTRLPEDIRAMSVRDVANDFHPRHQDTFKTYEYNIYNSSVYDPVMRNFTQHEYIELDDKLMDEAAKTFIGEHDFVGFCSAKTSAQTTVRTIYSCDVIREGNLITIRVRGNGFLYNMVRIIAGTLIMVGKGRMDVAQIKKAIETGERNLAGPTAPARGLTLVKVEYPALN